jgi:hypothetical protein
MSNKYGDENSVSLILLTINQPKLDIGYLLSKINYTPGS